MGGFGDVITLVKNGRGCYILDPVKGCSACATKPGGCYGDCYANRIAMRYGIDFSKVVRRYIPSDYQLPLIPGTPGKNVQSICEAIAKADMPFVRMGDMGDPSCDWEHSIGICEKFACAWKPIVIITKHWAELTPSMLARIGKLNICINTSVSAMDSNVEIEHRLTQYSRLKDYCKSILRVVSCEFDTARERGLAMCNVQNDLLNMGKTIDTIFRPTKSNALVIGGVIKTQKVKFLGSTVLASMHDKNAYLGRCETCPDMCGI